MPAAPGVKSAGRASALDLELLQDIREYAPTAEVSALGWGVNTNCALEVHDRAIGTGRTHGAGAARREPGGKVDRLDVVGLGPVEAQGLGGLTVAKLQGQDAHADEVGAVDALEALRDDGTHAQQQRTLARPVARGAASVHLARNHHQGDVLLGIVL